MNASSLPSLSFIFFTYILSMAKFLVHAVNSRESIHGILRQRHYQVIVERDEDCFTQEAIESLERILAGRHVGENQVLSFSKLAD